MKSEKSLRSIKSTRSLRTSKAASELRRNDIIEFENVLPMACAKFDCDYAIFVKKNQQNDEYFRYLKYADVAKKRISLMPQVTKQEPAVTPQEQVQPAADDAKSVSITNTASTFINTLIVNSIYDTYNSLTEIQLERLAAVPRVLMQIMGLLAPFYKNITRIAITNCKINGLTVYELSKIVKVSTVTQICLDGSPVPEANYAILLDVDNLRHLSLSRCEIDDNVCEQIASKLRMSESAEHLSLLNLSSNHITDSGAKSIADSLRTNRYLRYLNLADNYITDEGARCIFSVLKEFPLTCDEILSKRNRYFKYLKEKQALYFKYLNETSVDESSRKASKKRRTSATSIKSKSNSARKEKETLDYTTPLLNDGSLRAEMLAKQILGPFMDAFQSDCIKSKDGHAFCLGNMVLCYLNIAYNHLSYASLKTLCDVISHQRTIRKSPQTGLIKVVVDGNNIPIRCPEMFDISEMLGRIYQDAMRLKRQSIIK